jgi:ABC-type transport system involved in multi-copper enzyme maturation permease subunit
MKVDFLTDFPERLSPMLVKELRQGMRTKAFVAVFLTLQIILGVILLSAGAAASSDDAGETISNIIFIFFSIAVLIIQPMRGITSLSSEVKGNTIDMMVLTRLSAWRIVTGKWASIVSQSALLLVTIIPYLILR